MENQLPKLPVNVPTLEFLETSLVKLVTELTRDREYKRPATEQGGKPTYAAPTVFGGYTAEQSEKDNTLYPSVEIRVRGSTIHFEKNKQTFHYTLLASIWNDDVKGEGHTDIQNLIDRLHHGIANQRKFGGFHVTGKQKTKIRSTAPKNAYFTGYITGRLAYHLSPPNRFDARIT
jgi:hypothetical protein